MPVTAPLNGANRYAHIDAMRAFAVMLVVVAHAGLGHIIPGGSGVTIFFAISGFIITYLMLRERDKTGGFSVRGFYFRRAVKIGPPLFLAVVIPTLVLSIFEKINWGDFLAQVFFYFNWMKAFGSYDVLAGTSVVWSLSIEEQFYIVFALVWLLAVKLRHWRAIITAVSVAGLLWSTAARLVLAADPSNAERIYYGSDTRLDAIVLGVLAAVGYHWWQERGEQRSPVAAALGNDWALVAAVSLYLISLVIRDEWFRDTFRFTLQGVATCTIILYGLLPGSGPARRAFYAAAQWRLVQMIGLASYSIYLFHLLAANLFHAIVRPPLVVDVAITSALAVVVGVAVYRFVEVPARTWSAKARKKSGALAPQR